MYLIKLDATASTNAFLKELWQVQNPADETVVWARHQFDGRGQQGSEWYSEEGKNLTFSVLKYFNGLDAGDQFVLNMVVSLAIRDALNEFRIPQISIKWPNDIMSGSQKICGILIENMVKAKEIGASIIGIGLNVNQDDFTGLERASSLKLITGQSYDLDDLMALLIKNLQLKLSTIKTNRYFKIQANYEKELYRIGKPSTFELQDGFKFMGIIRGITNGGQLKVETEQTTRVFNMKEIRLLN